MGFLRYLGSLRVLSFTFLAFATSNIFAADHGDSGNISGQNISSVTVIRLDPEAYRGFQSEVEGIRKNDGTQAVVDWLQQTSKNPAQASYFQSLQRNAEPIKFRAVIHPHEQESIDWLNLRLKRMGLTNLSYETVVDKNLPDPELASKAEITKWKWARYMFGPGVALAATAMHMGAYHSGSSASDYLLLVLPAVGAGGASVILEYQFAHPWINAKIWTPFFKNGGPILGRLKNLSVNIGYGMVLWLAGNGAALLPNLWGGSTINFDSPAFLQALGAAIYGGALFTLAMGQYQTDIGIENHDRGSIGTKRRYVNESIGVMINNGARVGSWVTPGAWDKIAYGLFFAFRTWPQLIKTNINPRLQDLDIQRSLFPETAPKKTFGESCLRVLRNIRLSPLPKLWK